MKKLLLLYPIIIILLGFSYGKLIDDKAKSILKQFQMSENYAKDVIFQNTSGPSFYLPGYKEFKGMVAGDRAALVESTGKYVKEYTQSEDFKTRYKEYRESRKPSVPEKPKSMDELRAQQKEDMKKSLASLEESKKQMPKDQQSMFDETIKMFKEQLKEIDNPDNPMFSKEMDEYSQQAYQQQMEYYKQQVAEWEKEYPVNNTKPMIKKWLQTFLDKSSNIDFNAKLKDVKGKKVFENPEYEKKDSQWKLYFRAGKETVNAGRNVAQAWLKDLN